MQSAVCRVVQIVPLWNWNIGGMRETFFIVRSNCTFMELKWYLVGVFLISWVRSNCTFMELKFVEDQFCAYRISRFKLYLYGIEIEVKDPFVLEACSSNCTFMELKSSKTGSHRAHRQVQIVPLWNWNTVGTQKEMQPISGSNCTFMELKFSIIEGEIWGSRFKLYLYGIEIHTLSISLTKFQTFKLYLYGIEMSSAKLD